MRTKYIFGAKDQDPSAGYAACVICGQDTRHKDDTGSYRLCRSEKCREFKTMTEEQAKQDMRIVGIVVEVDDVPQAG